MKLSLIITILVFLGGAFMYWATRPFPHQELIDAIKAQDTDSIERLIDGYILSNEPQHRHIWSADNIRLGYGRTPLHVAAKYCTSPEPTKVLLEKYKCDPNAKNNIDRATPLHAAAAFDPSGLCALMLLAHGANPAAATGAGWTPIFSAVAFDNAAALRLLLEAGANPNHAMHTSPEETDYPLAMALRRGHAAAVYWLYRYGASVPATHAEYDKYVSLEEQATRHRDNQRAAGIAVSDDVRACLPPPKDLVESWPAAEALSKQLGYVPKVRLPDVKAAASSETGRSANYSYNGYHAYSAHEEL